jgi:hypothetical protein
VRAAAELAREVRRAADTDGVVRRAHVGIGAALVLLLLLLVVVALA